MMLALSPCLRSVGNVRCHLLRRKTGADMSGWRFGGAAHVSEGEPAWPPGLLLSLVECRFLCKAVVSGSAHSLPTFIFCSAARLVPRGQLSSRRGCECLARSRDRIIRAHSSKKYAHGSKQKTPKCHELWCCSFFSRRLRWFDFPFGVNRFCFN